MISIKTGKIRRDGLQKINKTLTKNMPHVKWKEIPPVKGPDSQGFKVPVKQVKTLENSRKINGRHRQSST